MSETEILVKIAKLLDQLNIDYMLTGSFALQMYGESRMTRDIDIVIELSEAQASQMLPVFSKDFYIAPELIQLAMQDGSMFNIIHFKPMLKVDFILKKNIALHQSQFNRRKKITVLDYPVNVISPDDLIIAKLLWAKDTRSPMQIEDIRLLLKDRAAGLDTDYIQRWVAELGLETILAEVRQ